MSMIGRWLEAPLGMHDIHDRTPLVQEKCQCSILNIIFSMYNAQHNKETLIVHLCMIACVHLCVCACVHLCMCASVHQTYQFWWWPVLALFVPIHLCPFLFLSRFVPFCPLLSLSRFVPLCPFLSLFVFFLSTHIYLHVDIHSHIHTDQQIQINTS